MDLHQSPLHSEPYPTTPKSNLPHPSPVRISQYPVNFQKVPSPSISSVNVGILPISSTNFPIVQTIELPSSAAQF